MRRLILCWFLMAGLVFAEDAALNTNDVEVAKAVEAMTVEEAKKPTAADEAAEAVEVAEIVKRTEAEEEAKPKKVRDPWDAFYPPSDSGFDWIQLTSGEWLKGDFKVLYDYKLEFDSDELDLLEFDFEDVKQLRTRQMKTVFMQGEGGRRDTDILRGMLEINGDEVILRRSEQDLVIPRSRVISIADGRQRERDYWSGMVSVGVNARAGNTDTIDITSMANIKRRTAATRFAADYISNYSESGADETANNQRLNGYYDRFLTAKFYWQVLSGEYFRDPFTNIDGQYSISTGLGYDIIHTSKTEWLLGVGVGYQEQKFLSVEVGKEDSSTSPFGTFGTRFEHEVTGNLDFLYDYSMRILNEDNGQYTHHMLTKLSFDVIKDLDLDVSIIWDRIEKPQAKTDGSVPEQDDYQLIVSLAYDF
ncbi:MAG: DUF481 domain-containing protein [Pontiella sp.]